MAFTPLDVALQRTGWQFVVLIGFVTAGVVVFDVSLYAEARWTN